VAVLLLFRVDLVWADLTLLLASPQDAANVRLNVAHEAVNEVLAVSYVFNPDRAGFTMLAQLRDAARKGKRTVLVLDQFACNLSPSMLTYLESEGVEIHLYRPFDWKKPLDYLKRMHVKMFVVDGKHFITGDRNVSDGYFGVGQHAYVNRDVYIQGNAAQVARDYIQNLIKSPDVKRFRAGKIAPAELKAEKDKLDSIEVKKLTNFLRKKESWKKKSIEADAVEFLYDPIDKKGKVPGVEKKLIEAIDRARTQITFENAYVVLTPSFKKALERASMRGVKIRAITNSLESTNSKPVGVAWQSSRAFLASLGAEIWEHRGHQDIPASQSNASTGEKIRKLRARINEKQTGAIDTDLLHAKTLLIDDSESFIMSYNFDPRSEKLNLETAAHIRSKQFASELESEVRKDIASSKYNLVATDGELRLPKNAPKPSCLKRVLFWALKSQL
jgi:putative cardiolipin synthase